MKNLNKNFLCQVTGFFVLLQVAKTKPDDTPLVFSDQDIKGRQVVFLSPPDIFGIVWLFKRAWLFCLASFA